jgi:hypothetical protein
MNNNLLRLKIQQRLNKLASFDYDNIECWQIAEAVNKAQREWFRRQVHGLNQKKEGSEQSIAIIDDLQKFITTAELSGTNEKLYFKTDAIPSDYSYFIKLSVSADHDKCKGRAITIYIAEEANADVLIDDSFKGPSFDWGESFATMDTDKFKVYTNNKFHIQKGVLSYYRKPLDVTFEGCINPATGAISGDQQCEFKDDVAELIIDEAVAIIAGDIESFNQYQRASQNAQKSN